MSSYQGATFDAILRGFAVGDGLPLHDAVSGQDFQRIADEEGIDFASDDDDVYTPPVTLFAWISQCLSSSKSCVAAVARVLVLRVACGLPPCSAATGGYCRARAKLSEPFLRRLACEVGQRCEASAELPWQFHARHVHLVDGAECVLADTPENQKEYPQSKSQKPGLGFPMIRLVVLLAFATACLVDAATGPCKGKETGETALLRTLLGSIHQGDIAVADRYYCSFFQLVLFLDRGADACLRMHQRRKYDFRKGKRLGKEDHIVTWVRPARPDWMDEETYATIPETLTVREVRFAVEQAGYRSKEIVVVTTLLDAKDYPKEAIAQLYHHRWQVELDIRAIKQTLQMDVLSCRSPEMVRKEVWVHLLAYNLARQVAAEAARQKGVAPRQVSFAGTVQTLGAFRWALLLLDGERAQALGHALLLAVGTHEVGNRPGRVEPRQVKRVVRKYGKLKCPRAEARRQLVEGKGQAA